MMGAAQEKAQTGSDFAAIAIVTTPMCIGLSLLALVTLRGREWSTASDLAFAVPRQFH